MTVDRRRTRERRNKRKRRMLLIGGALCLLSFVLGCAATKLVATAKESRAERASSADAELRIGSGWGGEQEADEGAEDEPERMEESSDGGEAPKADDVSGAGKREPGVYRIAIDPGHGGEDEGCTRDGTKEKDLNLQIAQELAKRLEEKGYEICMIRETDRMVSLLDRVAAAEEIGADLYVSIHQNACEETMSDVGGIETLFCSGEGDSEENRRLAALVQKQVIQKTGARDRGIVERDDLVVIRDTSMPACLVETGFLSNPEELQRLLTPEYQEQLAAGIAGGIDSFFHPKTLYLTFDDGPSAEYTDAILDTLKERGIHATFFVIGEYVERYPETARRIVAEGHTVGIHCYRHDYKALYQSADAYIEDFEKARQCVKEITGEEPVLFRFPGGSINSYNRKVADQIIDRMEEAGYVYFDWNASLEDAVKLSLPEQLIENAVSSTLGRKRIVMLAHDSVCNTALALNDLIDALPEYRMEPLTAEVEPIRFRRE